MCSFVRSRDLQGGGDDGNSAERGNTAGMELRLPESPWDGSYYYRKTPGITFSIDIQVKIVIINKQTTKVVFFS